MDPCEYLTNRAETIEVIVEMIAAMPLDRVREAGRGDPELRRRFGDATERLVTFNRVLQGGRDLRTRRLVSDEAEVTSLQAAPHSGQVSCSACFRS